MKKIMLSALMFLGVSSAMAAPASFSYVYCPVGPDLVAVMQEANSPFVYPDPEMKKQIETAKVGSIEFKELLLQSGIIKCIYSSSNHAVVVNLNPALAQAQLEQPSSARVSKDKNTDQQCGSGAVPVACPFITNTH